MKFNQFTYAKLRLYFETTKVFTAFLVAQVYNPTLQTQDLTDTPLTFNYKSLKLQEKFGCFDYSAYLCYNNKRKESYMETKDKKIQVHTIDNKDIDKFFPAHSEISSKGRKHTVKLFSR